MYGFFSRDEMTSLDPGAVVGTCLGDDTIYVLYLLSNKKYISEKFSVNIARKNIFFLKGKN